jgi:hypothetical protein
VIAAGPESRNKDSDETSETKTVSGRNWLQSVGQSDILVRPFRLSLAVFGFEVAMSTDPVTGYEFTTGNIREVYLNDAGGISIRGHEESDDPLVSLSFDQARELASILKQLTGKKRSVIELTDTQDKP